MTFGRPGSPSLEFLSYISLVDIRALVTLFPDFPLVLLVELINRIVRSGHPVIHVFFLGICLSLILVHIVSYLLEERTHFKPRPQISQVELYPRPAVLRLVQMNILVILSNRCNHCSRRILPIYTSPAPSQIFVSLERIAFHRHQF